MANIDKVDKPLIKLLCGDALQSSEVIAKKLDVSPATVRRRVRKLVKHKMLRIVGVVDPIKVGLPLAALMAFDVPHDKLETVADQLAGVPEVKWLSTTTGRFNIMAMVRTSSTDELASFMSRELPKLQGIRNCETLMCLHVNKGRYIRI